MSINNEEQINMQSYSLPSDKNRETPLYTALDMKKDLNFLEKKIDKVSREASVWDFYKITDIVNDKNNAGTMIKNLLPGESIIINTPTFKFNNETLSRGDILFKKNALEYVKIAAERGGTFFPFKIEQVNESNNYDINFKFFNGVIQEQVNPTIAKKTTETKDGITSNIWTIINNPTDTLSFPGLISEKASAVYSEYYEINNSINQKDIDIKKDSSGKNITPLIKFYSVKNELIDLEYSLDLSQDSTKWEIKWSLNSLVHYMVVK